VLAFFVIKIEQLGEVNKSAAKLYLPLSAPGFPVTGKAAISSYQVASPIAEVGTRNASLTPQKADERLEKTAFLTGSGSQTEIDVTHSKQTTAPILTGARTAFRQFRQFARMKPNSAQPPRDRFASIPSAPPRVVDQRT
jgi:hypothetical protein